jgi:hypothetical protein
MSKTPEEVTSTITESVYDVLGKNRVSFYSVSTNHQGDDKILVTVLYRVTNSDLSSGLDLLMLNQHRLTNILQRYSPVVAARVVPISKDKQILCLSVSTIVSTY